MYLDWFCVQLIFLPLKRSELPAPESPNGKMVAYKL